MKARYWVAFVVFALSLSVAAAEVRKPAVANEGAIGDKWMLVAGETLATVKYPPMFAKRGADACIALGYLIGEDGTTSDFSVLKQWNSEAGEQEPAKGFWRAFALASADAVSQWRFKPRPEVDVVTPVYTVATLGFHGGQGTASSTLEHCKIADLDDWLATMKSERFRRGDLVKLELELSRIRQNDEAGNRELERMHMFDEDVPTDLHQRY